MSKLTAADYRQLAAFRFEMRKFMAFSEQAARDAGIEPQQHQLLLAVKGLPSSERPTIGAAAQRLCVQHHTAVALVDKLEERALLQRERSATDRREVLLRLTLEGETLLRKLSAAHREHLLATGPALVSSLREILDTASEPTAPSAPRSRRKLNAGR